VGLKSTKENYASKSFKITTRPRAGVVLDLFALRRWLVADRGVRQESREQTNRLAQFVQTM